MQPIFSGIMSGFFGRHFSIFLLVFFSCSLLRAEKLMLSADVKSLLMRISTKEPLKHVITRPHANELLFTYESGIEFQGLNLFLKQSSPWLQRIQGGYDALLLKANPDYLMQERDSPKTVSVQVRKNKLIKKEVPVAKKAPEIDINFPLAEARLYMGLGERRKALDIYQRMQRIARYQADPYQTSASSNITLRRLRLSVTEICQAHRLAQTRKDIIASMDAIECIYAPQVYLDYTFFFSYPNLYQLTGQLSAEAWVHRHWRLGATVTHGLGIASQTQLINGDIVDINATNFFGTLYAKHEFLYGDELSLELYGAQNYFGAGAEFQLWEIDGFSDIRAELNKPFFTYVALLAQNGARSRIQLSQDYRYLNTLNFSVDAALNRYTVGGSLYLASSLNVDVAVRYYLPSDWMSYVFGPNAQGGATYTLNGEYPYDYATGIKQGATGPEQYQLLPLLDFELHTLYVNIEKSWDAAVWTIEGDLGVAYSRYPNTWGVNARASAYYSPISCFQTGLTVRTTAGNPQTNAQTYTFEAFARLHY